MLPGQPPRISPGDIIATSAIIVGFGLTVLMFRINRELWVQEKHPEWESWLAYSDRLILSSVALAFVAIVLVLGFSILPASLALCAGGLALQAGYIPAILAHYRIGIGAKRKGSRVNPEPAEKWIVRGFSLAALLVSILVWQHSRINP